ncbi:hypothetical protein EV379_3391 [Microterricola gilva]|uniref:Uncharacterized protein n=1 Tax=Microterricola gilva TaxID=393267 RepID=A0A4V2GB72_9MICO|nr:hypothetical protein [Microterricola gilva]RZU67016.1 hypothetical protein EV379_3391 [Microterricola gilva]
MTAPTPWARTRRLLGVALFGAMTLLPLAACTSSSPELDAPAATQLQSAVLLVTESSAAGDFAAALQQLDAVEAALLDASVDEQLSAARAARIHAAIMLVRADLEAAMEGDEATPAPDETTPTPDETSSPSPTASTEPTFDPNCNRGQEKKGACSRDEPGED